MKFLVILIILTGLGLSGSAFFGIYTAPGLEGFPTVESLGVERRATQAEKAQEILHGKKKGGEASAPGIFPTNPNGAINKRNNYLQQQKTVVAPGSKR